MKIFQNLRCLFGHDWESYKRESVGEIFDFLIAMFQANHNLINEETRALMTGKALTYLKEQKRILDICSVGRHVCLRCGVFSEKEVKKFINFHKRRADRLEREDTTQARRRIRARKMAAKNEPR